MGSNWEWIVEGALIGTSVYFGVSAILAYQYRKDLQDSKKIIKDSPILPPSTKLIT
jgi:hypothetical protein